MHIEADHDRHIGADTCAHPGQYFAFPIGVGLGDHGPVQIQINPVEGHQGPQLIGDTTEDRLESMIGDRA